MPQPTIKLNIRQGSITSGIWSPPNGGPSGVTWKQGMELTTGSQNDWNPDNWTTPSVWGYYYIDPANNNAPGGQINIPTQTADYLFTVGPQGGDSIAHISVKDEASTNHYTISQAGSIFTITESEHDSDEDHFCVWGTANGNNDPIIMCDPIIRNRK
jgi:hypothetical protein